MCARLTMHGWRKDLLKTRTPLRIHLCQGSTNRGARAKRRDREGCKHAKDSAKRRQHFRSVSRERCPVCHSAFLRYASGKFERQRVRSVAFAFAVAVFLFALVLTTMLPL